MAQQLLVDLYGCDRDLIDDADAVTEVAREAVARIGAEIVEECVHRFSPIGVSYIAVITTSHLSIHTWPEYGYAAIDVFSCSPDVPEGVAGFLFEALGASNRSVSVVTRHVGDACEERERPSCSMR